MSYGTSIRLPYGSVYLNKLNLKSKYDLESEINDASEEIQGAKEKLKVLVSATPRDLFPNEEESYTVSIAILMTCGNYWKKISSRRTGWSWS